MTCVQDRGQRGRVVVPHGFPIHSGKEGTVEINATPWRSVLVQASILVLITAIVVAAVAE